MGSIFPQVCLADPSRTVQNYVVFVISHALICIATGGDCYRVDQGSKGVGSEILKHQIMDCSNVPLSGVSGFMVLDATI